MFSKLGQRTLQSLKPASVLGRAPARNYGQMTKECADQLKSLGITNKNIVFNPS